MRSKHKYYQVVPAHDIGAHLELKFLIKQITKFFAIIAIIAAVVSYFLDTIKSFFVNGKIHLSASGRNLEKYVSAFASDPSHLWNVGYSKKEWKRVSYILGIENKFKKKTKEGKKSVIL